ncbi:MAG: diguanylate cyclase (GGDEF)-like protein [Phenylobacterium sp.]
MHYRIITLLITLNIWTNWPSRLCQRLLQGHSTLLLCLTLLIPATSAVEVEPQTINQLLDAGSFHLLRDLDKTNQLLQQLSAQKNQFSAVQRNQFTLLKAAYFGSIDQHHERVSLVRGVIDTINNANIRVQFLYELTDSYVHLGEYEQALVVMNQGIRLLPKLTDIKAKISMLQGATTLLVSLSAYVEAQNYANRMYQIGLENNNLDTICIGLTNQIEILFKLGDIDMARAAISGAVAVCDESNYTFNSSVLRGLEAVNLIDSGQNGIGVKKALNVLDELQLDNNTSSYIQRVEEAIARSYYHMGDQDKALAYGLLAYQRNNQSQSRGLMKDISLTLSQIKRAQGDFAAALAYNDIYLRERARVEQDKSAKNLAYQQVKYDSLDKTSQLEQLKFSNNSLILAQRQQTEKADNLMLMVILTVGLLLFLTVLVVVSLRQKRALIYAAPGENQGYHLSGFLRRSEPLLTDVHQGGERFCMMLFELDDFAELETHSQDTMGHSLINEITEVCKLQVRQSDQLSRISEQQFAICIVESSEQGAIILAERCQRAIASIDVENAQITTPLAATFGIAMIGDEFVDASEAMIAAQKALHLAKDAGRNQIFVHNKREV